jgi:hypothetical protein
MKIFLSLIKGEGELDMRTHEAVVRYGYRLLAAERTKIKPMSLLTTCLPTTDTLLEG